MNTLQAAIVGGALIGFGIALLALRFLPADPDLADVVNRYDPTQQRPTFSKNDPAPVAANNTDRLGIWGMRHLPAAWWGKTPTRELALLRIPVYRHYGQKITYAIAGLIFIPILTYMGTLAGISLPIPVPVVVSLLAAVGLFYLPDYNVRDDAKAARSEFGRALSAYCDLVALERVNGSGATLAMENAASIGTSWVFRRIDEELARARWSSTPPWDSLHDLSEELGLPELAEVADILRLTEHGSQVYDQLRARAHNLRSATKNAELAKANAMAERMSMPMSLLGVVFLVILIAPSVLRIFGSV